MLEILFSNPILFIITIIGLVLAITIHEFSHAFVADKLGDPTPRYQGRVTLDPRAHLDPIGTLAMLLTRFGWGKPVMFDPYNLKEPIRDTALIALAGPLSNIIFATILSVIIHLFPLPAVINFALIQVLVINLVLAVFNLIPVYPLDGSKIILVLLPRDTAYEYEQIMNQYGTIILLALILPIWGGTSAVSTIISPVINLLYSLFLF